MVFFVGEGGRPPNPRRGTNRKGWSCAGGDGVGAVGVVGSGGNKNMNCKGGAEFWERNSEGMGGVRVFFGGCE